LVVLNSEGMPVKLVECKSQPTTRKTSPILSQHPHTVLHEYKNLFTNTQSDYVKLVSIVDTINGYLSEYIGQIVVGYENYSYGSTHKAERIGELGGVLKSYLAISSIPTLLLAPTQIKMFATGYGQATKDDLKEQAQKECPKFFNADSNDDICDAYFIARLTWYLCTPEMVMKYETSDLKRRRFEICRQVRIKLKL
jgi:Holliday junction resolvasome RuvABC endonuclease subunit